MISKIRTSYQYLIHLFAVMGIVLLNLTVTRILFQLFNFSKYKDIGFKEYLAGGLFDLITISIYFIPYFILFLLPLPFRGNKIYRFFFKFLFHVINTVMISLNLIDVEFIKFTSKRSGFDVVQMMNYGSDFTNLIDAFALDYWYLILIFLVLIVLSEFLYRRIPKLESEAFDKKFLLKNSIVFLVFVPLFFLMGRGIGLRPIGVTYAGNFVKPRHIPFSLNTPFTVLKSINDEELIQLNYFEDEELTKRFDPIKTVGGKPTFKKQNVVVIILESFSQEFIGKYNKAESYTPFLDSLIDQSLFFPNAWANGKRSIQAVPAIFNSIPALMRTPYISSNYATNDAQSLPEELKKIGYSTSFFHGASNGSMGFDTYAKTSGIDNYYGRDEYGNDIHFDGNWGIYDEYFFPWMVDQLDAKETQPFFATLFSLSSHHPYKIPSHHKFKFKEGPTSIFKAINYTDYCLRLFFEEAQKKDWFKNTVFIITADHTADSKDEFYGSRTGQFKIPLLIYHPKSSQKGIADTRLASQIDIMPTVLDLVSEKETQIYSFGNSLVTSDTISFAINFGQNVYHLMDEKYQLVVLDEKPVYLYNHKEDPYRQKDSVWKRRDIVEEMLNKYKAIIQTHNRDMAHNKMKVER